MKWSWLILIGIFISLCLSSNHTYANKEMIYVVGKEGGSPVGFPNYFQKVSSYIESQLDFGKNSGQKQKGTEENPININETTRLLKILKECVIELEDSYDDVDDVIESIEPIEPVINELDNPTLRRLCCLADYLLIKDLHDPLVYFIMERLSSVRGMGKLGEEISLLPSTMQHSVLDKKLASIKASIEQDLIHPKKKKTLKHSFRVREFAYSPDGKKLVTASDKICTLWDVKTARVIDSISIFNCNKKEDVCFSPDGKNVAILYEPLDTTRMHIALWNIEQKSFHSYPCFVGSQLFVGGELDPGDFRYISKFTANEIIIRERSSDGVRVVYDPNNESYSSHRDSYDTHHVLDLGKGTCSGLDPRLDKATLSSLVGRSRYNTNMDGFFLRRAEICNSEGKTIFRIKHRDGLMSSPKFGPDNGQTYAFISDKNVKIMKLYRDGGQEILQAIRSKKDLDPNQKFLLYILHRFRQEKDEEVCCLERIEDRVHLSYKRKKTCDLLNLTKTYQELPPKLKRAVEKCYNIA